MEVLHYDHGMAKILDRGEHNMQGQLDDRAECALRALRSHQRVAGHHGYQWRTGDIR